MKAIFFILNNAELVTPLLDDLNKHGITGGTMLNTNGIAKEMVNSDFALFGTLRQLLNDTYLENKMLIFIATEEKQKTIIECINRVCGDLTAPNTGVIFTVPVDFTQGIKF